MTQRQTGWFVFVVVGVAAPTPCVAQLTAVVQSPVSHPVASSLASRTPYAWRQRTGAWGETLAEQQLRLRGFNEVHAVKSPGGQGIDLVAVRRRADQRLLDVRLVEVKTHRASQPALAMTRDGHQLSRSWLASRLRAMRNSRDLHSRRLALEMSRFFRQSGVSIESFRELHAINTRAGTYSVKAQSPFVVASTSRIDDVVRSVRARSSSPTMRQWAKSSLASWDEIRSHEMRAWLADSGTWRHGVLTRGFRRRLGPSAGATNYRSMSRLTRVAGRLGLAVAAGYETYAVYSQFRRYERGEISRRAFVISTASSIGGTAGASAGAATGAWIGSFGGPVAWITVPAGTAIGGFAGYYGGSTATANAAETWYSGIDERIRLKVDQWHAATPYPLLRSDD